MLIGVDDTDSLNGGCTTYIAALLCRELSVNGYPRLIRLNPNIPFKTRGNGAIALDVKTDDLNETKEIVLRCVERYAHMNEEGTNPGIVFIKKLDRKNWRILNEFYKRAVSEIIDICDAEKISTIVEAEIYKFNNGRGIIGALAAIGAELRDRTYELIAYRLKENYGKERRISEESVFEMNSLLYPETFDNIDLETGQILITPHGYDPVFCGIRGETPEVVKRAWNLLEVKEEIEGIQIFETNQATDDHLREKKISDLKPYDSVIIEGRITRDPRTIAGGHVIFAISDGTGEVACAAYEPTGNFRDVIRKLKLGDLVRVFGGIGKYANTINLEKIQILRLRREFKMEAPIHCGRRMTSAGKGKGFKCRKCSERLPEDSAIKVEIPRELKPGFYEVPPRARRHLSKPLIRMMK